MSIEFLVTSFIVIVSPGTGVLYTLAAGLSRGSRASVVAAFGCTIGIVPHMAAAIMGLAALLHTSALAFETFKYLGVAYLLYMAWNTLRERGTLRVEKEVGARSAAQVTVTAILINILNPKLSIFFLAFLPQFVSADESASAVAHARAERRVHADDVRGLRRLRAVRRFDPRPRDLAPAGVDLDAPDLRRARLSRSAPSWPSPIAERTDRIPVEVCKSGVTDLHGSAAIRLRQIDRIGPFVELDRRAPWIRDERERAAVVGRRIGPIHLDPGGFELLDEALQVLHVEADVVEHPPLGGGGRRGGLGEPQLRARNVRDRRLVAHARLGAERLRVPGLALGDRGFRQEEVDVLVPDRNALLLVLQDLDLQAVRRGDVGLVRPVVVAGLHRHARGLPLGDRRPGHSAPRSRRGSPPSRRCPPDGGDPASRRLSITTTPGNRTISNTPGLDCGAAHPDEDFLVGLHVGRVEMPVSHGHAHVVGRVGLRPGRSRRQVRHEP